MNVKLIIKSSFYLIIIYCLFIQIYNWMHRPPLADLGCFRQGCGPVCINEQGISYGGKPPGYNPDDHTWSNACGQDGECYTKFGACIHYGDACGWKPTPELAECLARKGDAGFYRDYNPLNFTRSYCDTIIRGNSNSEYRDYCKMMFRDLDGSRRQNR